MSVLAYRCPKTLQDLRTSIITNARALEKLGKMKLSVACPHCIEGHIIPTEAMLFRLMQRRSGYRDTLFVRDQLT
jgi:hypothetical protein